LMICFALSVCEKSPKIVRVDLIDRNVATLNEKPNPLLLVVEIDEKGRLSLNKIETGTLSDLSVLNEKLEVIFDDRENQGIGEREIIINPQAGVNDRDLEKLIENLTTAKAAPIRIIKNNF
jgi:biopolymer transport protein ExbD